jgi:hypothetical protein
MIYCRAQSARGMDGKSNATQGKGKAMRILRETSVRWGNGYRRYYFDGGVRVSEAYASWLLKNHLWEDMDPAKEVNGRWVKEWNIGPMDPAFYARLNPSYI